MSFLGEDEFAMKMILPNNKGQSVIVTQKTNTEKKNLCLTGFLLHTQQQ